MFQSSPAPRRGRYYPDRCNVAFHGCFNPRPHQGAGATYFLPFSCTKMACFNPRPHQGAGATGAGLGIKYGHAFQSSPAPRRGRYAGSHMSRPWPLCFNPRPHQGAGATIFAVANGYEILVSILARTKARALLALFLACNTSRMFQSSPAPRRGRYKTSRRKVPPQIKFQSSPAPRRGRYLQPPLRAPRPPNSFNPRPHQGAGATLAWAAVPMDIFVSILARTKARALRLR